MNGKLVRLRPARKDDIAALVEYQNEPETKRFYQSSFPPASSMDFDAKIYAETRPDAKKGYEWVIETVADGQCIGECGYLDVNWKNSVSRVVIYIGTAWCSRGYGTEALKLLLDYMFLQMNLHKVRLDVFSFNERAIRTYQKCGFQIEGQLRQEVFQDGAYHDLLFMGLLRDEWGSRR